MEAWAIGFKNWSLEYFVSKLVEYPRNLHSVSMDNLPVHGAPALVFFWSSGPLLFWSLRPAWTWLKMRRTKAGRSISRSSGDLVAPIL